MARKICSVFASYMNSQENIHADRASQTIDKETECSLADNAFVKIIIVIIW